MIPPHISKEITRFYDQFEILSVSAISGVIKGPRRAIHERFMIHVAKWQQPCRPGVKASQDFIIIIKHYLNTFRVL